MEENNAERMDLNALEAKVDELIALCDGLLRANQALREERKAWLAERDRLRQQKNQADGKLDAMIGRLKTLEDEF